MFKHTYVIAYILQYLKYEKGKEVTNIFIFNLLKGNDLIWFANKLLNKELLSFVKNSIIINN